MGAVRPGHGRLRPPELNFDPLDDTRTWPEDIFPLLPAGRMTLNRNVENYLGRAARLPRDPAGNTRAQSRASQSTNGLRVYNTSPAQPPLHVATSTAIDQYNAGGDPLGVLDSITYAQIRPYPVQHVAHCPLRFEGLLLVQVVPGLHVWDADADMLVAAAPDLLWRTPDGVPVWRETKSVALGNVPSTVNDALVRWPQVALALLMLAHGVPDGGSSSGQVHEGFLEVEVLDGGDAHDPLLAHTLDAGLVSLARRVVAEAAYPWSQDQCFPVQPGRWCGHCSSSRWCEEAQGRTGTAPTGELAQDWYPGSVGEDEAPF